MTPNDDAQQTTIFDILDNDQPGQPCRHSGQPYRGPIVDNDIIQDLARGQILRCPACGRSVRLRTDGRWPRHQVPPGTP